MDLLGQLRLEPGGEELLELAPEGAFLVGGAVRDLLLDSHPRELDVVVEDEGSPFGHAAALLAGALASRLNTLAPTNEHPRFGTAVVEWDSGRIDVAAARRERYPAPGALPEVEPAPLAEDLLRRDFTVNAIAVTLKGHDAGEPRAVPHELGGSNPGALRTAPLALKDLGERRLRVLHERSFLDDPTRLLRLARYVARLDFTAEEDTARLAAAAVAGGALTTVSGARIGAELRLALAEPDPLATLAELDRLGVLGALHPRLRLDLAPLRRALELLPADGRADLLALAGLALGLALRADGEPRLEIVALLDRLEFPAADRDRVAAAATAVPRLVDELPAADRPSRLRALALPVPLEAVALAGALDAGEGVEGTPGPAASGTRSPAGRAAARWLNELRHVRLRINGDDLLAAGIPQGPEIGRRLERVLRARLDGELPDEREAQLRAALEGS
jgi:tRNA nucleotidyltransferase (CCA-adding enzyme)